jgi:hypothetical protein
MGSTFSSRTNEDAESKVNISNKLDQILGNNNQNGSDTLAGITELQQNGGGCGDNDFNIENSIRNKLTQSGGADKYTKYDIKHIMGKISNDILNAGNTQNGGADDNVPSNEKPVATSDDVLTTLNLGLTNTEAVQNKPTVKPPTVATKPVVSDDSDNSANSDGNKSSEMGISTNTNERLETKILKSIFEAQHGGAMSYDESDSSSSSSDAQTRRRKNRPNAVNNNKGNRNRDQLDKMADGLEKMEQDITKDSNKHSKASKRERREQHKKQRDDSEKSEESEESEESVELENDTVDDDDDDDSDEISESEENVETSNGSEEKGLSIFPFDSESNSYKNFRMLKRSV